MTKTLHILTTEKYNDAVLDVLEKLPTTQRVCYLTCNKTVLATKEGMWKRKIDASRYVFIDTVSPLLFKNAPRIDNCTYVNRIDNFAKLAELIITVVKMNSSNVLVIDSLSTLIAYGDTQSTNELISQIMSFLEKTNTDIIIFALQPDKDHAVVKQTMTMVDKTITPKRFFW